MAECFMVNLIFTCCKEKLYFQIKPYLWAYIKYLKKVSQQRFQDNLDHFLLVNTSYFSSNFHDYHKFNFFEG